MSKPVFTHLPSNNTLAGQAETVDHVIYSEKTGMFMRLFLPWDVQAQELPTPKRPLIVFVQGSAWTTPNLGYETPLLSRYAQEGYLVASVCHRSVADGFAFPAFLQDVKCAIRFLRANADKYGIDKERILIWGTSSGGNTAELVGLTAGDPAYETDEFADEHDDVCAVVSCFGPANLNALFVSTGEQDQGALQLLYAALGADQSKWQDKMREFSPTHRIEAGKQYPPFLLVHGDADPVVPFAQSVELAEKLAEQGTDVTCYEVEGAIHEGNFWSAEVLEAIHAFIVEKLK